MNLEELFTMDVMLNLIFAMLLTALCLAFIRLTRGPTLPDRVVALDLIAALSVAVIVVYAIASDQRILLDAAIVLALVTFLGTVAFAQYVERRAHHG